MSNLRARTGDVIRSSKCGSLVVHVYIASALLGWLCSAWSRHETISAGGRRDRRLRIVLHLF